MDHAVEKEYQTPFELIDGKVVMMSPRPRVRHAVIAGTIYRMFANHLMGKRCTALPDGVDLILDDKHHFIPDAMIVCDPDKIKDTCVEGAPDLVVEVLSPSTAKRDRGDKAKAYAQAGVRVYWIVSIEVYHNEDGRFELVQVYTYYSEADRARNAELLEEHREEEADMPYAIPVELDHGFDITLADIFEN